MKRREFITLLGGAAAWPLAARAQQGERMRRIGVLMSLTEDDPQAKARLVAFRQELARRGWSEDRNIHIDYRFAPTRAQAQLLAKELVAMNADVVVAQATPGATALQRATRTVPVVFLDVADPIGLGLVASLARPGGNLTGLATFEASVPGKWFAMLKEIWPRLVRAAFVANPKTTQYEYYLRASVAAASSLGIELMPNPFESAADIEHAIESFARVPDGGLVVVPDPSTTFHRDRIIALAARHRLPAVYHARFFVAAGGLMSYGIDRIDAFRQATSYVDRILRGTSPADLPVQLPSKYEMVVNLKTAKALGLSVPPGLLVAADEVIE
jgi:putative tryptophan/tyrosine transport system substrate-binding protein